MSFTPKGAPVLRPFTLTPEQALAFLQDSAPPPYGNDTRCKQLERYEAFLRGAQYDHQDKDWWGMSADLWETVSPSAAMPKGFERPMEVGLTTRHKRPSIETGTAATVVNDYTALMFSEQTCPRIIVEGDKDTEAMLIAIAGPAFWQKWTYARNMGGGVGSVAITAHARDGKIDLEVHNPRQVTVLWKNRRQWLPAAILKTWSVFRAEKVMGQKGEEDVRQVEFVYRRIITEADDVVFLPIRMDDPATWGWVADPALTVHHGLGFFPGVWVQNTPEEDDLDGDADCEGAWKQIDALDRMMSQINKACLNAGDPTPVIMYDEKAASGVAQIGSTNAIEPGIGGDAKFLEMAGTSIEAMAKICDRLERYISQRTGWVPIDPAKVGGGQVSSLALKLMFRSMIQAADKKRGQYGPAIVRTLEIIEKILRAFDGKTVELPDAANGGKRVGKFTWDLPGEQKLGEGGEISIQWGPYFSETTSEEGEAISNAAKAKATGLIDSQTASEHVAGRIFQVRDVEEMRGKIAEEQAAEAEHLMAQAGAGVSGRALDDALGSGTLLGTG